MEENNNILSLAYILAYHQVRCDEEWKEKKNELEIIAGSKIR